MSMPALVVNEKVVAMGKVLKAAATTNLSMVIASFLVYIFR